MRPLTVGGEAWFGRFSRSQADYLFKGSLPATHYLARHQVPEIRAYLSMRLFDSGMYPCLDLIEIALGVFLPEEVVAHQAIQTLRELCVACVAFTNDLFSYEKERVTIGNPINLVHCLMTHRGLPLREAVAETVALTEACVAEFQLQQHRLPQWGPALDPHVAGYVQGMWHWMRGSLDWSRQTGRYRTPALCA